MDEFIGIIKLFAGNYEPRGWMFCHGQTLAISQNQALFAILGITYGGDGVTTFKLPDLTGRIPLGAGYGQLGTFQLGEQLGNTQVTVHQNNLPLNGLVKTVVTSTTDASATTESVIVNVPGNNQPVNVQNPALGLNYIICVEGLFPSRN